MPIFACIGLLVIAQASLMAIARAQPSVQSATSTGVITGRATINGRPAPNVRIVLEPFDSPASDNRLPRTVTDEEGKYRFTGIPEGRFQVKPVAHSFVIAGEPGLRQVARTISSGLGVIGLIVTLTRGETIDGLDFALTPGSVITGRVIDADGRPVVEGTVHCQQLGGPGSLNGSGSSETDDRGVYRIYGLPAGDYLVSVSVSGRGVRSYRRTFHPSVTDQAQSTPVKVAIGAEARSIDIQLGRPDAEKEHLILGRVVDGANGQPVPGGIIGYRANISAGGSIGGSLTSDSQGRFEIRNCYQGRYVLQAISTSTSKEGFYGDPMVVEVIDDDVTDIEIKAHRGASISGVLVVDNTNDPAVLSRLPQLYLTASWPRPQVGASEPLCEGLFLDQGTCRG
ncbi:MAG: carboxypeptidase regulatory-like domain-containing protein [Acidobacteria bacterium]|nr:carboxypeptidase regulatory-like domain-containing protein [Acidobacteriota bacterium]